jgi:hypothetical protein
MKPLQNKLTWKEQKMGLKKNEKKNELSRFSSTHLGGVFHLLRQTGILVFSSLNFSQISCQCPPESDFFRQKKIQFESFFNYNSGD